MDVTWFADKKDQESYNDHPFNPADWFGMRQAGDWEKISNEYLEPAAAKKFIGERRTGWMYLQIARFLMKGDKKYFPALNLKNNRLLPGFFDIHTHGGAGYEYDDIKDEEKGLEIIEKISMMSVSEGVTSFLPKM